MPLHRLLKPLLILLLCAWQGGISDAAASAGSALGRSSTDPSTQQAGSNHRVASSGLGDTNRAGQQRILFILANSKVHGSSSIPASISFGEVVHAWDTFQAAGYAVDFVTPDGGDVPILAPYVGKEVESRLQDERVMRGLRNTATPAQIDPGLYRAVYYVGGSNAMYGVAENRALQDIAMHVYERNGGVVSAVCHGTAGIVNLKLAGGQSLLAGKRITGYPEEHEDRDAAYFKEFPFLIRQTVQARGGLFHAVDGYAPYIEVDGRVMTGQNYASAAPLAAAVVDALRKPPNPQTSQARRD